MAYHETYFNIKSQVDQPHPQSTNMAQVTTIPPQQQQTTPKLQRYPTLNHQMEQYLDSPNFMLYLTQ